MFKVVFHTSTRYRIIPGVLELGDSKESLKTPLPFFLLRPPSVAVWGSSRCSTQSHLWGKFNTHPAFQNRTEHAFIRSSSQLSRKLRKLCQSQVHLSTSALALWPSLGGSVEEFWSNTWPDRSIAKELRHPKGFGGIWKPLSFLSLLFFLLENKHYFCVMTPDQMNFVKVNI